MGLTKAEESALIGYHRRLWDVVVRTRPFP